MKIRSGLDSDLGHLDIRAYAQHLSYPKQDSQQIFTKEVIDRNLIPAQRHIETCKEIPIN